MLGLLIGISIGGIVGFMSCAILTTGEYKNADSGDKEEEQNGPERVSSANQED